VRQQVGEKPFDSPQELAGLGKRTNVSRNFGILPRKSFQLWNKVRVRKEAHIEYQIRVGRNPVTITKAHYRYKQWAFAPALKAPHDELPKLVNIEIGGVDHGVS
jgi:hypothetical protein